MSIRDEVFRRRRMSLRFKFQKEDTKKGVQFYQGVVKIEPAYLKEMRRDTPEMYTLRIPGEGIVAILSAGAKKVDGEELSTVDGVFVRTEYRGRGLAGRLLKDLADTVRRPVLLEVDKDNTAAIRAYEKIGFKGSPHNHPKKIYMRLEQNRLIV